MKAFKCVDMIGGQYVREDGMIITCNPQDLIVDADEEQMYLPRAKGSTIKKVLRFGFEEVNNYLPPATPLDVKLEESKRLKALAKENAELKKKLEAKDED